ncbi:MAG: hypothetical protein IKO32_03850 [Lachnospiraceae bacterium]|nr:hypothetical protein [Lachnospiraceae bacterium]
MKKCVKRIICLVAFLGIFLSVFSKTGIPVHAENAATISGNVSAGDIIKFGKYEQDGNTANGKEDIEWQVLKVEDDRVLVISKYALDRKRYNEQYVNVTWETCTLRAWLNADFLNAAFSDAEKNAIPQVPVTNESNSKYGTYGGNVTNDKVFILSVGEVKALFPSTASNSNQQAVYGPAYMVEATQYAVNNGASQMEISSAEYESSLKSKGYPADVVGRKAVWWWMRTPGMGNNDACAAFYRGFVGPDYFYSVHQDTLAVRPAMYISRTGGNNGGNGGNGGNGENGGNGGNGENGNGNNEPEKYEPVPGETLVRENGKVYYYKDGVKVPNKYGFVNYNGSRFLVVNGVVATYQSGLTQDPDHKENWYYCAGGQVQNVSQLVMYDGAWFYVVNGKLDTTYSGYVSYDGGLFFVGQGRIMREVNGLAKDPNGPNWYFLANGQAQIQYTGLAQYDNAWFYIIKGKLAEDYTGTVTYDGAQFRVVNGMLK